MTQHVRRPVAWRMIALVSIASAFLGGCATFSTDGGFAAAQRVARSSVGKELKRVRSESDIEALQQLVAPLLTNPLSVDDTVQIALFNNPSLQATYADLGIAEADLVQAGRLINPGFRFQRTRRDGDVLVERAITVNIIRAITLPLISRIEGRRFEQVQLRIAAEVLRVAADTRKAYFEAVAAEQGVIYARQVNVAAEAGADLGNRMARAGNWSRIEQAREQAFYAEATAGIVRTSKTATVAREKLTRLMGLWGQATQYTLPDRLPELPTRAIDLPNVEATAMKERLDIQAATLEVSGLTASLGLTRATRFVNVLDVGYVSKSETGIPREAGYEIGIELPIFDRGDAKLAKSEALYMQAFNRVRETAINARSEIRESYLGYHNAYELAKHYRDNVVPLRKLISEENQLRYNGMLISVFELLADARDQITSVTAYIDALKDFWVAESNLQLAIGGKIDGAAGKADEIHPMSVPDPLPSSTRKGN